MPEVADYAWITDVLHDAACVTLVGGATSRDVLAAFGADTSVVLTSDEAFGGDETNFASVAAVDVPGGVVAVELNGFQGSLEGVLRRVSMLGPAASIFWNVNDDNAFSCAHDGDVVAVVDMYDAEDPSDVDLPAGLMALFALAGEDQDGTSMWAVGLAMAVTFTEVRVREETVRAVGPFHPVPGA